MLERGSEHAQVHDRRIVHGGRHQGPAQGRWLGPSHGLEKLAKSAGGKIESIYFAFGEEDVFVIGDFPDNASAAAVSLAVGASGAVRARTVPLLTIEEIDIASKKSVDYRKPGA